ncbi:hypothetical protein EV702DRAFT_1195708 [Suillus placidus]|uniref:Helitron helicase-like domain-containing protein n=1 Tax=Suillus placidus TaxID=48579 RepID=A0A9P7D4W1_9AGAM|nr:hypothetical protein EV702DRAFT_1195708 [Suillus placidus]
MAAVAMVEGNLLPPKPITLASMLGVSIIGPNNFPEHCMPSFLTVSRSHLRNALLFLKQHNPLYFNITISDKNIALFPECGIPDIILSSVRHLHNVEAVDAERQDYVPEDDVENVFSAQQVVFPTGHDIQEEIVYDKSTSDIFPVQCHGVLDSAVAGVDDNQVFAHALANTAECYTVQHRNTFVNEYPRRDEDQSLSIGDAENPNHLLGAFPCLFPYAAGGFEVQRHRAVPYKIHAQWAMRYADRHFRKDMHFMFEVFGVIQKRQVCRQAVLQVKKQDFHRSEQLFRSLAVEDLRKASEEEQKHQHVSNPTVRALKRHLTAVRSKVMGMDENSVSYMGHVIAEDPYAAAKFFHFMITAILEELFCIKEDHFKYNCRPGIFGTVEAYVGTIEAQGRGTLHLHMIIWLRNAPTSSEMKELLQSDVFRAKVASFIARNIQGHHSEVSSESLKTLPRQSAVSYSRPPDPRSRNFSSDKQNTTRNLRRALFALAKDAWIDSEGHWGPKRTMGAMNNWNLVILLATRANHDIKLITDGEETKDIGFYISMYAAKNQQHSSNALALLAKSFAFHQTQEKHNSDAQALNKLLIQRCANSLSREQEFSAPEVVTYLMKWGDHYISHHFEAIYFSSIVNLLKKTWPHLVSQQPVAELSSEGELQTQKNTAEAYDEEYAVLQFEEQTQSLQLCDQIREYMDRADALEEFSYMDYFLNTYDTLLSDSNESLSL